MPDIPLTELLDTDGRSARLAPDGADPADPPTRDDLHDRDRSVAAAAGASDGWDDDPDAEFAAASRSRLPRLTALLGIAVLLAGAFLGGVLVQRNSTDATAASALPAGFPAGFPGAGGAGAGTGGGAGTTGTAAGGTGSAATGPAVIGTVVSVTGARVVVRDLGGTEHVVETADTTTVTRSTASSVADLAEGDTVSVSGTTAADGSVVATGVTVR